MDMVAVEYAHHHFADNDESEFQPDRLASWEYFRLYRTASIPEPEKKLMFAILEDAISCFENFGAATRRRKKRLFQEARDWLLEENGDWIFSFVSICETLGIDPERLRGELMARDRERRESRDATGAPALAPARKTSRSDHRIAARVGRVERVSSRCRVFSLAGQRSA